MTDPRRAWSVAIFARCDGQILLIRHKRLGRWLPPGGEIEPGETPLEAAKRELLEETGLVGRFPATSAIDGVPPGFLGYEEHEAGSKGLHLNLVFLAEVPTQAITPNDEFEEWRWVSTTDGIEAPPNVHQFAAIALAAEDQPPPSTFQAA